MKIVRDSSDRIFGCTCKELSNHQFEIIWKYSGTVKGFLICVSEMDMAWPEDSLLIENIDLQESIDKGANSLIHIKKEAKEWCLIYLTQDGFKTMGEKVLLPREITALRKIQIWWLTEDRILMIPADRKKIILPMHVSCQIIKEYRKTGFFKKEWFCDLKFSSVSLKDIRPGAVYYMINGIKYPVNPARMANYTLKIENESIGVSVGIFLEYSELYTMN